jgi:hypothetical protein
MFASAIQTQKNVIVSKSPNSNSQVVGGPLELHPKPAPFSPCRRTPAPPGPQYPISQSMTLSSLLGDFDEPDKTQQTGVEEVYYYRRLVFTSHLRTPPEYP